MTIEVIQYFHPNGRPRLMHADLPDELALQYQTLQDCGARFTAEIMPNNNQMVVLYIEKPNVGDFMCEFAKNDSEVTATLVGMLRKFDLESFLKWQHSMINMS